MSKKLPTLKTKKPVLKSRSVQSGVLSSSKNAIRPNETRTQTPTCNSAFGDRQKITDGRNFQPQMSARNANEDRVVKTKDLFVQKSETTTYQLKFSTFGLNAKKIHLIIQYPNSIIVMRLVPVKRPIVPHKY